MKDKTVAYLLWCACFLGICGLQRIYLGKYGTGFLYVFTLGLFGIGQLIDLFAIPGMVEDANNRALVRSMGGAEALASGLAVALPRRAAPRNTEEMQVALVQAAEQNGGQLTVAEGVAATGRGFKDVERQLTEMAVSGYVEVDSDDAGTLVYRFPGLGSEPGR